MVKYKSYRLFFAAYPCTPKAPSRSALPKRILESVSDAETEYTIRFFFFFFTETDSEIRVVDAETEHGTRFGSM